MNQNNIAVNIVNCMYVCIHVYTYIRQCMLFSGVFQESGLTRECPVAITADIETRNFDRNSVAPIECSQKIQSQVQQTLSVVFSVLRDMVGKDFTLKQVCTKNKKGKS